MEKLLHERLREHEQDAAFIFSGDGYEFSIMGHEADKLADEIERQYEPRKPIEIHDADNVPIKEGDVLWLSEYGRKCWVFNGKEPFKVTSLADKIVMAKSSNESFTDTPWSLHPEWVTHQEPDSLKKLIADMRRRKGLGNAWADRLEELTGESCER